MKRGLIVYAQVMQILKSHSNDFLSVRPAECLHALLQVKKTVARFKNVCAICCSVMYLCTETQIFT